MVNVICQPGWTTGCLDIWSNSILVVSLRVMRVVVVQLPNHVRLFVTPWIAAYQSSLSFTISQSLPEFMSIASAMLSSHLILWCSLLLLPSVFPSIRDFSNESAIYIRWQKYWSFSFSISLSKKYTRLISFKIDWLCPRDSQESFPEPQFKGISSFSLCLLYDPTLTTVCDHWEDHSLDYVDLCFCFSTHCLGLS